MSKEIGQIAGTGGKDADLTLTQFWGGKRGKMLQITQGVGSPDQPGFIALTKRDVYLLIEQMVQWLKGEAESEAGVLRLAIEKDKALEKSILQDAVDCAHYIQDLRVLKIPLRLLGG